MFFDPSKAASNVILASDLASRKVPDDFFVLGPRFLPKGGRMALIGSTGIGKSWLCLSIIKSFVSGLPLFGNSEWPVQKQRVLLIESEVGLTLGERIQGVFQDTPELMKEFYVLSQPEGFNLTSPQCAKWLKDLVKDMAFGTIIIDPISDLADLNENDNREIRKVLTTLRDIQGPDVAAIFTHHTRKPPLDADGFDPLSLNNTRGGSKFGDFVDCAVMINRLHGKLVANHESWKLAASFEKTRHANKNPGRGHIHFNEHGDYRMEWRGGTVDLNSPAPARPSRDARYVI